MHCSLTTSTTPLPPPIPDGHALLSVSGTALNSDALRFTELRTVRYQRYSSGLRQYAESLRSKDYKDLTPISQNYLSEISVACRRRYRSYISNHCIRCDRGILGKLYLNRKGNGRKIDLEIDLILLVPGELEIN
ncbi:hypothetical protein [Nostoc sp.]|uniref:hypothetical protein n=1 Tax=Nostoc sp. TaxID=1180 RepID=UPI002FFC0D8A